MWYRQEWQYRISKSREGSWNDVPNVGYNDTQTKHIKTSSLVEHGIPTAPPFRTNFTKVDEATFHGKNTSANIWNPSFFSKQNKRTSTHVPWIWKKVVVTFAHAGTGMTDSSEMVQCMRSRGFPKPAYIDSWLVGQNPQNIHTIHTPSMRRTCKSTPLLCTRIWTMVSFPTSRNVDQVRCQSRSEMNYHILIWNLSKKSLIFSR